MKLELDTARRGGSHAEIQDLELLLVNAARPHADPMLAGAASARNRQSQRRYLRSMRDPNRPRVPVVGDIVMDPAGRQWPVTRMDEMKGTRFCLYEAPGKSGIRCPVDMVRIVAPMVPVGELAPVTVPLAPTAHPSAEALYQGAWDALEGQDWALLEQALRAYERDAPASD